jgi:hypothetical protein
LAALIDMGNCSTNSSDEVNDVIQSERNKPGLAVLAMEDYRTVLSLTVPNCLRNSGVDIKRLDTLALNVDSRDTN